MTGRSWTYFKRAHLHANGLGTAALAMVLLLAALPRGHRADRFNAVALGLGALGYSLFWMLAGLKATLWRLLAAAILGRWHDGVS